VFPRITTEGECRKGADADFRRLLLLRHNLQTVVADMARELGIDLALLLAIASRAGKPAAEPPAAVGGESIHELVAQDAQVLSSNHEL
jgi:hypothetical protein